MSTEYDYPRPFEDADNRPLLEAWRAGLLVLQHCSGCGGVFFYPRPLCPTCWSQALEWRNAQGIGQIVSYSLVFRPSHPAFGDEIPIVLAEIALPEGVHMIARIVCENPDAVRSGLDVELISEPEQAARYPLPTFRLSAS